MGVFHEIQVRSVWHLKKLKTFVEKQSGGCIKLSRSDRGREFREFNKFCKDKGVERQLIRTSPIGS